MYVNQKRIFASNSVKLIIMKRSNNDCQDNDTYARRKKQIILVPFLMKNESNFKPLAKATLKRHVLAELEKEDKVVQHDKNKALKKFKKLYNINNAFTLY